MGGPGSGNRYRWGAKASTDACQRLDLSSLHQGGWLRPGSCGTIRWWRGERLTSSIGWVVDGRAGIATALELRYAVGSEEIRYRVPIAWTACHLGGRRPWFVCPGAGCGRRAAVLYGRRLFLCHRCHDLAYASTRQEPGERALRKAQRIRERLGGRRTCWSRSRRNRRGCTGAPTSGWPGRRPPPSGSTTPASWTGSSERRDGLPEWRATSTEEWVHTPRHDLLDIGLHSAMADPDRATGPAPAPTGVRAGSARRPPRTSQPARCRPAEAVGSGSASGGRSLSNPNGPKAAERCAREWWAAGERLRFRAWPWVQAATLIASRASSPPSVLVRWLGAVAGTRAMSRIRYTAAGRPGSPPAPPAGRAALGRRGASAG